MKIKLKNSKMKKSIEENGEKNLKNSKDDKLFFDYNK
jgi:hypothetical protein